MNNVAFLRQLELHLYRSDIEYLWGAIQREFHQVNDHTFINITADTLVIMHQSVAWQHVKERLPGVYSALWRAIYELTGHGLWRGWIASKNPVYSTETLHMRHVGVWSALGSLSLLCAYYPVTDILVINAESLAKLVADQGPKGPNRSSKPYSSG